MPTPSSFRRAPFLASLLLCSTATTAADAGPEDGCAYRAEEVAPRIKSILGPHYAAPPGGADLEASFHELEILLLDIGHCRAVAQSGERPDPDRQRHVGEWHSLNQWLYRLVNFVRQNARGDDSVSWRDEYALFAEVYEFEP